MSECEESLRASRESSVDGKCWFAYCTWREGRPRPKTFLKVLEFETFLLFTAGWCVTLASPKNHCLRYFRMSTQALIKMGLVVICW